MVSVGNFYWDTPLFGDGTSSNPSIRFVNDSNTGLFLSDEDAVGVATSGNTQMTISNTGLDLEGNLTVRGTLQTLGNIIYIDSNVVTSEEVVIRNAGLGPALSVRQDGLENIMTVYDDANIVMHVYDGGETVFGPGTSDQLNGFTSSPFNSTVGVFGNVVASEWFVGNVDSTSLVSDNVDTQYCTVAYDTTANTINANTITLTGNIDAANGNFTGDVLIAASDSRLKDDICIIPDALDQIRQIHGYTFRWRGDIPGLPLSGDDMGVLAQEVQGTSVGQRMIAPAPFDHDTTGQSRSGENYLTVKYQRLHALQIQCIHELLERLENAEATIQQLKNSLQKDA
jgi:hypothetical protein